MNVGDTFTDEHGEWRVLSVHRDGRPRAVSLIEGTETQAFEDGRKLPPPEPDPDQDAIDAFAGGDTTQEAAATLAMAKRMASA